MDSLNQWMRKNRLAALSYETDVQRLTNLFPLIGNVPADCLTPARIGETLDHLKASMSDSTVNRYRSAMSSVYTFAISVGKMTTNPVSRVKRYRENPSRLNWLRPEQEKTLRAAIDTNRHEAEFTLLLNTGMRRGENWNLVWRDVDLVHGNITVHGKTGRRHIPTNAAAKEALLCCRKSPATTSSFRRTGTPGKTSRATFGTSSRALSKRPESETFTSMTVAIPLRRD